MQILLLALHLVSVASAAPANWMDVSTADQEVSVGRVLWVAPDATTVALEERRNGVLADSEVAVRDSAALAQLRPGDTVMVYREASGTLVVAAR